MTFENVGKILGDLVGFGNINKIIMVAERKLDYQDKAYKFNITSLIKLID